MGRFTSVCAPFVHTSHYTKYPRKRIISNARRICSLKQAMSTLVSLMPESLSGIDYPEDILNWAQIFLTGIECYVWQSSDNQIYNILAHSTRPFYNLINSSSRNRPYHASHFLVIYPLLKDWHVYEFKLSTEKCKYFIQVIYI